jgi:hypothetical protein
MVLHSGQKEHVCELCKKAFAYSQGLKEHMAVHAMLKIFSCDICNKSFTRAKCLSRHKLIHVGLEDHVVGTGTKATMSGVLLVERDKLGQARLNIKTEAENSVEQVNYQVI